jgi:ABC-type glycerol-3-phosphate transport system permease component
MRPQLFLKPCCAAVTARPQRYTPLTLTIAGRTVSLLNRFSQHLSMAWRHPIFPFQPIGGTTCAQSAFNLQNVAVIMAASLLTSLPTVTFFLLFQKHFTKGIALSGIKG